MLSALPRPRSGPSPLPRPAYEVGTRTRVHCDVDLKGLNCPIFNLDTAIPFPTPRNPPRQGVGTISRAKCRRHGCRVRAQSRDQGSLKVQTGTTPSTSIRQQKVLLATVKCVNGGVWPRCSTHLTYQSWTGPKYQLAPISRSSAGI